MSCLVCEDLECDLSGIAIGVPISSFLQTQCSHIVQGSALDKISERAVQSINMNDIVS